MRSRHTVQILMAIRPGKDLSLSHTPDTAEDSERTVELPLLLRPAAALDPRISAAERSRSLYFRCKKQQKQLGASVARRSETAVRSAVSVIRPAETRTRLAALGTLSRNAGEGPRCIQRKAPLPHRGRGGTKPEGLGG